MDKKYKLAFRKKILFDKLNRVKLQYIKNGICDSYIKYGKPSLSEVLINFQDKTNNEFNRLQFLIKKLKSRGIKYDERVKIFTTYTKRGGDINKVLDEGETEFLYWNFTDFPSLINKYPEEIAKNIAMNKYIRENGRDKYINKIIKKEMTLNLY